jgi:parallel beta-helix repeat protein
VQAQVTGANISEQSVQVIIYVDTKNPKASDNNPGTAALPLKTLSKATELAGINNTKNLGVKVLIAPGTYRESVGIWQATAAPIIFEAQQKGTVAIAGSDVWTGWQKQGVGNIYTHAWPYDWGLANVPDDWQSDILAQKAFAPIVRRREMIVAAGAFLKQVLSYGELINGSFYIDEANNVVYLQPPVGMEMTPTTITEVAVRPSVLLALKIKNLVLRGIIFKHANSPLNSNAVEVGSSSNILVEDCQFIWNNWGGLGVSGSQNITVRRSIAKSNGAIGMAATFGKNFLFEDTETSYNNWRGILGGYTGWSIAGLKHLFIHDAIYRRHKSMNNNTLGFWLDSDSQNVLIDGAFLHGNLTFGMFIEANQGPVTVKGSTVCHNHGPGFLINNSENVTLENNILYGNERAQILMEGAPIEGRPVKNWETGEQMVLLSERWAIRDNDIVGKSASQLLLEVNLGGAASQTWTRFKNSLVAGKNLWYNPALPNGFQVYGWSAEVKNVDFSGWKSISGKDSDSVFTAPQFISPDNHQF